MVELTYLLKYTETRNSSEAKADWSIRQIGVYHRYDPHAIQSTWILLFPTADSSTRRDLVNELSSTCDMEQTAYHPLSLHISLMQARIHNWRLYVSRFENEVWELVRLTTSVQYIFADRHRQTLRSPSTLKAQCRSKMLTKTSQTFTTLRQDWQHFLLSSMHNWNSLASWIVSMNGFSTEAKSPKRHAQR